MKKYIASIGLALLATSAAAVELNRLVLRVNNRVLTLAEYQDRRDERLAVLQRSEMAPSARQEALTKLGEAILAEAYEELLLLSRADQVGIDASPRQIEEAMARQRESFGFETDQEFELALLQAGMTRDAFETQMGTNLVLQELMATEVRPRVTLEEEDLRRFYNENRDLFAVPEARRVRETIVLESSGLGAEELVETAAEIRARVIAGEDLAAAVVAYRERDMASAAVELGWVESGDLEGPLDEAVWDLQVGELSAPVPARGGVHLLEVLEVREYSVRAFREVADEIGEREGQRRMGEEMQSYITELADQAYVVSRPPADAAGFEPSLPSGPVDPLDPLQLFQATPPAVEASGEQDGVGDDAADDAAEGTASEGTAAEGP